MATNTIPTPEIRVKDAQSMEHIHWEDCILLLKIGEKEIQWGLYKRDAHYFIQLCSYIFDHKAKDEHLVERIKAILSYHQIETEKCYKVSLVLDQPLYTVVPNKLYKKEVEAAYFTTLFGENTLLKIQSDDIPSKKMKLIYGVSEDLLQYLEQDFKAFSIYHNQALLLNNIKKRKEGYAVVYATLHPDYTSLAVFSDGTPLLMQSYATRTPLDVVYYILNALNQLNLEGEQTFLYLTGYDKDVPFLKEKMQSVFHQINGLKRPKIGQLPKEIEKYSGHYFYHLVNLALCELLAEN